MTVVPSQSTACLSLQELNATLQKMLKRGSGVGGHLVLLIDMCTPSVIGILIQGLFLHLEVFLRADVHAYKFKYDKVL